MQIKLVSASNDNIDLVAGARVLGAFLVAGSDAASASIFDAATQTGTAIFTLKALANSMSAYVNFNPSGISFKTAISVTLAGTSPVLYLVYE